MSSCGNDFVVMSFNEANNNAESEGFMFICQV